MQACSREPRGGRDPKSVPTLEAVLVGEGYERDALEAQIRAAGAQDWLRLPGRVSDAELVQLYQRAWVLTSASLWTSLAPPAGVVRARGVGWAVVPP